MQIGLFAYQVQKFRNNGCFDGSREVVIPLLAGEA
jgi:hypothetical protein